MRVAGGMHRNVCTAHMNEVVSISFRCVHTAHVLNRCACRIFECVRPMHTEMTKRWNPRMKRKRIMHESIFPSFFSSLNFVEATKERSPPPLSVSLVRRYLCFHFFCFVVIVNIFTHFYAQNSRSSVYITRLPCMCLLLFLCAVSFRPSKFLPYLRFVWEFDNSMKKHTNYRHSVSSL